jgi:hypothetical protein
MRKLLPMLTFMFVALVGGACSDGDGDSESASGTTTGGTTTTAPGPGLPSFLAEVRAMDFGNKDMADPSPEAQDALIELANLVCEGIPDIGYGRVVQGIVESDAKPSPQEATEFVHAAVRNVCPEYQSSLPG